MKYVIWTATALAFASAGRMGMYALGAGPETAAAGQALFEGGRAADGGVAGLAESLIDRADFPEMNFPGLTVDGMDLHGLNGESMTRGTPLFVNYLGEEGGRNAWLGGTEVTKLERMNRLKEPRFREALHDAVVTMTTPRANIVSYVSMTAPAAGSGENDSMEGSPMGSAVSGAEADDGGASREVAANSEPLAAATAESGFPVMVWWGLALLGAAAGAWYGVRKFLLGKAKDSRGNARTGRRPMVGI